MENLAKFFNIVAGMFVLVALLATGKWLLTSDPSGVVITWALAIGCMSLSGFFGALGPKRRP